MDFVFTHTVPFKYIPTERLLSEFEQKNVDQSTEVFLDKVESNLDYTHGMQDISIVIKKLMINLTFYIIRLKE